MGPTELTTEDREELQWDKWVTDNQPAIWISVADQQLRLVEDYTVIWAKGCSTAEKGVGARLNTNQTPPGWHNIKQKIGNGEPKGRVFRSRGVTEQIWQSGQKVPEDLVLTRILVLEGMEDGKNKGTDKEGFVVDSLQRLIYIHGTNDEDHLNQPLSKGCIRLSNDDVIWLFDKVSEGTRVVIDDRGVQAQ